MNVSIDEHSLVASGKLFQFLGAEILKHLSPTDNTLLRMVRMLLSDIDRRTRIGVYTVTMSSR